MTVVRTRRTAAIAALAAAGALTLSGCATGFHAQTNKIYQAGVGANERSKTIDVLGALVVVNTDGSATVSAGVINQTSKPEQLTGVAVSNLTGSSLPTNGTKKTVPLDPGTLVKLGETGGDVFTVDSNLVTAGDYVKLTLSFDDAAAVTLEVPAVTRTSDYNGVAGS